jgi:hypothetical protein
MPQFIKLPAESDTSAAELPPLFRKLLTPPDTRLLAPPDVPERVSPAPVYRTMVSVMYLYRPLARLEYLHRLEVLVSG